MRAVHVLRAAAVASLGITSAAQATLTVTMVRTPISAAAQSAEPGNLGSPTAFPRTFDIQVTQGAGEHWSFGSALTTLTSGTFYTPTAGNLHTQNGAGPANLAFDTAVSSPDGGSVLSLLGKADYPVTSPGTPTMPGSDAAFPTYVNSPNTIDLTWGDQQAINRTTGDNTYTVARLTVLQKSAGQVVGHVGGTQHNFTAEGYTFTIPLNGDFDGNGATNGGDISAFIAALSNDATYHAAFPAAFPITSWYGDFNNDGAFNGGDISGFIGILSLPGPLPADQLSALQSLVPEPTTGVLLGGAALAMAARRRRLV